MRFQYAVVGLDLLQKGVRQFVLPIFENRLLAVAGQYGVAFEPVGADRVQRAEQSVKERGDVEVRLRIFEIPGREIRRSDPFAVAEPVRRGDPMVYAQDFRQLFGGERRQLSGQLPGLRAVKGRSGAGYRQGGAFGHRFGAGEEYLHDLSVVVARLLRKTGRRASP